MMVSSVNLEENDDNVLADKTEIVPETKRDLSFKRKLVVQVRKHRMLFDNRHKLFSNVAKKELVWQQIAEDLKADAEDCKNIWFDLRFNYQRHVRRLQNYFLNGHKENRKRPVMYMESELMFLWRFIDKRKSCKLPFDVTEINKPPTIELEPDPTSVVNEEQHTLEAIEPPVDTSDKEMVKESLPICSEKLETDDNENDNSNTQKPGGDDDLILVEQPVECIVIDEDDENNKKDKQFKVTPSMKLLIGQIKAYPELYDSELLTFKDYTRKSYVWNAIACNLSDKATKLMKSWIIMQTRYEWEISQTPTTHPKSELQVELEFLKDFIVKNPDTVYKQSYYLKTAWFDPIDYFKDIYNLIVRMKKNSDIVYITDSLLKTHDKSKQYLQLWTDIATLKGSTAGQCETTWLIMRYFYWELMYMRQQNYQLTDKWYFETIITELYAISKANQTAKQQEQQVLKQTKPSRKPVKRPAQTNATTLGAPSAIRPATNAVVTTISTSLPMTPTIVNNLSNVPQSNATFTTPSTVVQQPIPFPKITAAISLAPQALSSGSLQIKPIPGPPNLAPAPAGQVHNIINGGLVNTTGAPMVTNTNMPITYNLPTQTKVTTVPMPPLIRPVPPLAMVTNAQPIMGNAQITVRPRQQLLRPQQPKIQITPLNTTQTTNMAPNITMPIMSNTNTTNLTTVPQQSIASFKITTLSGSNPTTTHVNIPVPSASTPASSNQLPKISGAVSLLNPNEILIELIASQNGNQLVVHGPPLSAKYQLSMPTVAKFIREILALPLLHNKRLNKPSLMNVYWEYIAGKFNLPVHICRACWNFLLENFNHFPQIAPLKDLMRPFTTQLTVWKESTELFKKFDDECLIKGWHKYYKRLPEVMECIGGYPVLYQDVSSGNNNERLSDMETLCAWRTIGLRFPKIPEIQEIWSAFKTAFCQYMTDLEFGVDNKWPINWWRSLARLKFLVEAKYTANDPFFYIISNKMLEQIDKFAMLEMRNKYNAVPTSPASPTSSDGKAKKPLQESSSKNNNNDILVALMRSKERKECELGTLITAIQKHPVILNKADSVEKYEAWKEVAKELHMEVSDCMLAFKEALKKYFAYKKQNSLSRCRLNERYYKKLDEIVRNMSNNKTSRGKLNIKTPLELNQSIDTDTSSNATDLVFPERFISDISMSNCPSNLVVKNWVYAMGNVSTTFDNSQTKLKAILSKYIDNVK